VAAAAGWPWVAKWRFFVSIDASLLISSFLYSLDDIGGSLVQFGFVLGGGGFSAAVRVASCSRGSSAQLLDLTY
jgi:hypothetical protein